MIANEAEKLRNRCRCRVAFIMHPGSPVGRDGHARPHAASCSQVLHGLCASDRQYATAARSRHYAAHMTQQVTMSSCRFRVGSVACFSDHVHTQLRSEPSHACVSRPSPAGSYIHVSQEGPALCRQQRAPCIATLVSSCGADAPLMLLRHRRVQTCLKCRWPPAAVVVL